MKLETAMNQLIKEVNFLGFKNLGELVEDMSKNPLAYPLRTLEAYRVYRELAHIWPYTYSKASYSKGAV